MSVTPVGIDANKAASAAAGGGGGGIPRSESGSSLASRQSNSINKQDPATSTPPGLSGTANSSSAAAAANSVIDQLGLPPVSFSALTAFAIPETPEGLLAMAKMSEVCERYDEMLVCMKRLAKLSALEEEFGSEERHLLHVAYRQSVLQRRGSWRIAKSSEQRAELDCQMDSNNTSKQNALRIAQEFRVQLENEITDICTDLIVLVENVMFPRVVGEDAKIFLFKLAGDFYRYLAEVNPSGTFVSAAGLYSAKEGSSSSGIGGGVGRASGRTSQATSSRTTPITASIMLQQQQQAAAGGGQGGGGHQDEYWVLAQEAYARATELASSLRPSHPTRLSIALNLAIFYYETMRSTEKALHLAREAFSAAISDEVDPSTVLESEVNESGAILQLLQENLFFWTQPDSAMSDF